MKTSTISTSKCRKRLEKIGIAIVWIAIWQLCYWIVKQELLLASPFSVLKRLGELMIQSEFWKTVAISCLHIFTGFILGVFLGVLFAVLSAKYALFCSFLSPVMTIVKATPVASFIILALIWIQSARLSVFISFLLILPLVYTNTLQGIRKTDIKLLEMAEVYQMSAIGRLRYIYIPQVLPYFFSACITGVGFAWKSGIAAEILAVPKNAIGTMLYESKIYLETTDLFAWTAVVILLSLFFEKIIVRAIQFVGERWSRTGER